MIYWLSTRSMTIEVTVDDAGKVTSAPPIARKFIGQPAVNLISWMRKQGVRDELVIHQFKG